MEFQARVQAAHRMRQARQEAHLTQDELARELGVSRQTVSAFERALSEPTMPQLHDMGILFGASLDYLIYGLRTVPAEDGAALEEVFRLKPAPPHKPNFEDSETPAG